MYKEEKGFIYPLTAASILFVCFLLINQVEALRLDRLTNEQQMNYVQHDSLQQLAVSDALIWLDTNPKLEEQMTTTFSYPHGTADIAVSLEHENIARVSVTLSLNSGRESYFVLLYDQATKKIVDWEEEY